LATVISGADPTTVQVLMEDVAAVSGVFLAGSCLTMSHYFQTPFFDSVGSISIGLLLGGVASFLIKRNISSLVESSIPPRRLNKIMTLILADPAVVSIHDVKATSIGHEMFRFKAEVNFNSKYIIERYIEQHKDMLVYDANSVRNLKSNEQELSELLVRHGGGIINTLSEEKNRIERNIHVSIPLESPIVLLLKLFCLQRIDPQV
jgi:zinc transporter 9